MSAQRGSRVLRGDQRRPRFPALLLALCVSGAGTVQVHEATPVGQDGTGSAELPGKPGRQRVSHGRCSPLPAAWWRAPFRATLSSGPGQPGCSPRARILLEHSASGIDVETEREAQKDTM